MCPSHMHDVAASAISNAVSWHPRFTQHIKLIEKFYWFWEGLCQGAKPINLADIEEKWIITVPLVLYKKRTKESISECDACHGIFFFGIKHVMALVEPKEGPSRVPQWTLQSCANSTRQAIQNWVLRLSLAIYKSDKGWRISKNIHDETIKYKT